MAARGDAEHLTNFGKGCQTKRDKQLKTDHRKECHNKYQVKGKTQAQAEGREIATNDRTTLTAPSPPPLPAPEHGPNYNALLHSDN